MRCRRWRLTTQPVNVLRATLEPDGLAPRIRNLPDWRRHLLARLRRDFAATGDPAIAVLHDDLSALPTPVSRTPPDQRSSIAVPLYLQVSDDLTLALLSTTTVFGTASDITLSELTLETFFPADAQTRAFFLNSAET